MKKTALIIGATGLIGRALVDELLAQESIGKVIALTRRDLSIADDKFENHIIDFGQLDRYQKHFQQVDYLFSCLGTTKKEAGSIERQRVVDLEYQFQVAELGYRSGIEHYFLVSSSGASATSLSPYLKMKGALENKVIALGFKRCVIFQPSLLLGEREQQRPGEFFAGKIMPLLAYIPLLNRYRPITGHEVAKKMAQVSCSARAKKESVQFYTLNEIF